MSRSLVAQAALGLLIAVTAACNCKPVSTLPASASARGRGFQTLRPLDEAHGADFRKTFDEASRAPRYVVALSPT
jgi:hypothetical protein